MLMEHRPLAISSRGLQASICSARPSLLVICRRLLLPLQLVAKAVSLARTVIFLAGLRPGIQATRPTLTPLVLVEGAELLLLTRMADGIRLSRISLARRLALRVVPARVGAKVPWQQQRQPLPQQGKHLRLDGVVGRFQLRECRGSALLGSMQIQALPLQVAGEVRPQA